MDDEMMTPDEFVAYVEMRLRLHSDAVELVQRIIYQAWGLGVNDYYKHEFVHDLLDDYAGITPELIDSIEF